MTVTMTSGSCQSQIPEALGLASGVVFLVCIVLFQQLHHLDLPATLQHVLGGR